MYLLFGGFQAQDRCVHDGTLCNDHDGISVYVYCMFFVTRVLLDFMTIKLINIDKHSWKKICLDFVLVRNFWPYWRYTGAYFWSCLKTSRPVRSSKQVPYMWTTSEWKTDQGLEGRVVIKQYAPLQLIVEH